MSMGCAGSALLIIALLYGIVFAFACHYIAGEKGKDQMTWAVIGFFLGLIGLLIIGFSEKEVRETKKSIPPALENC